MLSRAVLSFVPRLARYRHLQDLLAHPRVRRDGASAADEAMDLVRDGHFLLKQGLPAEAMERYRAAVTLFRHAGHPRRARAVLRLLLRLSPHDDDAKRVLAEIIAEPPPEVPAPLPRRAAG